MIPDLELPEYYVESVDIDITPEVGHTVHGQVSSQFTVQNPELCEDPAGLTCEAELELDLYRDGDAPWQISDPDDADEFGHIHALTQIFIPGEPDEFSPHYEEWNNGSYRDVDREFMQHLESGILHQVISPLGDLVGNSFNGVVPRMIITPPEYDEQAGEESQ
ncbi:hypothetical protein [Halobellus limi]|uniref:Uncharacterized protein n=1 Tax=Halobellus limi TaxID=699433 RepID=A0A1H6BU37_9EURY|nr:hypothetical protein [Halobellus limi]QCC49472.1 hypothetical protein DV707_17260 [Halobellus limi]SEG64170.1 hypothetical protein SAMN04488133_3029 [Halobellus limi]